MFIDKDVCGHIVVNFFAIKGYHLYLFKRLFTSNHATFFLSFLAGNYIIQSCKHDESAHTVCFLFTIRNWFIEVFKLKEKGKNEISKMCKNVTKT